MKAQKTIGFFLLTLITVLSLKAQAMAVEAGQTVLVEDGESYKMAVVLSVSHGLARLSHADSTFVSLHRVHPYHPVKELRRKSWIDRLLAREGQVFTIGQEVLAEIEGQSRKVAGKIIELTEEGLARTTNSNGLFVPVVRLSPVDVTLENKLAKEGNGDSTKARF